MWCLPFGVINGEFPFNLLVVRHLQRVHYTSPAPASKREGSIEPVLNS